MKLTNGKTRLRHHQHVQTLPQPQRQMEGYHHLQTTLRNLWKILNHRCEYTLAYSVGQGAYGIVVAAKEKEELVAIKKIDKAFEHKIFAKRTLR